MHTNFYKRESPDVERSEIPMGAELDRWEKARMLNEVKSPMGAELDRREKARMAELVDALDSKSSSGNGVWVRFPLRVQKSH